MTRLMILLCAMGLLGMQVDAAEPTVIKPAWEVKLPPYGFTDEYDSMSYQTAAEWLRQKITFARETRLKENIQIIPPNEPVVDGNYAIVSTPHGGYAFSIEAIPNEKPPLKTGDLWWIDLSFDSSLELMKSAAPRSILQDHWGKEENKQALVEQIFNHSANGRITVQDGLCLFQSDFSLFPPFSRAKDGRVTVPAFFFRMPLFNYCRGIDTVTGKILFRLGRSGSRAEDELASSFFLASPLVVSDTFYTIYEKEKSLQLVCLNSKEVSRITREPAIKAKVPLVNAPESAASDLTRRIHTLIPIATEKLILCPSHLGAVVAVNRDDHKIAWTARYGKLEDKRFENFSCTWRVRPMLVAGDVLIYGPADAESLYAFKLADGKEAWKIERGKGVYLAGLHDGKSIVVDSNAIRAIDASNGKEVWKAAFDGTLTGYGVFQGDRFYQPIGLGKAADEGVLQIIDLKQGKAVGTIQRADKKEFGNLLIHKGKLISQTFESLSVFAMP